LVAADVQRDSLDEPEARWAIHPELEEVYAGAIMVHDVAEDALLDSVFEAAIAASDAVRGGTLHRRHRCRCPANCRRTPHSTAWLTLWSSCRSVQASGWWSLVAVRNLSSAWQVTVRPVPASIDELGQPLAAGESLPPRGVTMAK
jgi:hypothetical protein